MSKIHAFVHGTIWALRHVRGRMQVPEIPLILPLLRGRSVFVDVGAHGGSWSIPFSREMKQVLAFEALPHYASSLRILKMWLRAKNVKIINSAVSDKPGYIDLVWKDPTGRRLTGFTHVAAPGETLNESCRVPALTLDDAILDAKVGKIDLIKCDVEGAEYSVFSGGTKVIARDRPIVYSEVNDAFCKRYGKCAYDTYKFFADLNYSAYLISDALLIPFQGSEDKPFSNDLLFVPRD
jgi:FkbM family methyltransferase